MLALKMTQGCEPTKHQSSALLPSDGAFSHGRKEPVSMVTTVIYSAVIFYTARINKSERRSLR